MTESARVYTREPNIPLFPDAFFKPDTKAEKKYSKGVLQNVPCYDAKALTNTLAKHKDLFAVYENIKSSPESRYSAVNEDLSGHSSLVFSLHIGDPPYAIKLYYNAKDAASVAAPLLASAKIESDIQKYILYRFHEPKSDEKAAKNIQTILAEAAGFVLGNKVAPKFVAPLDFILSVDGSPVGHATRFFPGKSVNIWEGQKMFKDDKELMEEFSHAQTRLAHNHILLDFLPASRNAIVHQTPKSKQIQLIDLYYEGDVGTMPVLQ